ncbi:MAG: arylesterase [Burkholderiales bacterium]|nr:arylesterase [Burkholderiales bacterium]
MSRRALLAAALFVLSVPSFASNTVMVFGDSLSAAYNLASEQGWVQIVARRIEKAGLPWRVVNASLTGETTTGGLRRIAHDLREHKPAVVVIELGANDALRGQPVAGMRSNLEQIVRLVKQARAEPVLVGMMIPPNYGIDYAAQFGDMYRSLASRSKAPLVPFLLDGVAEKPELFQPDQMHPTAAAQERIADNVWSVLEPLLKKKAK